MSKAQKLEAKLKKLSPAKLQQLRHWLDDVLEKQPPFTGRLEPQIEQSAQEKSSGARRRTRRR